MQKKKGMVLLKAEDHDLLVKQASKSLQDLCKEQGMVLVSPEEHKELTTKASRTLHDFCN